LLLLFFFLRHSELQQELFLTQTIELADWVHELISHCQLRIHDQKFISAFSTPLCTQKLWLEKSHGGNATTQVSKQST
jgi:hypothetical protein